MDDSQEEFILDVEDDFDHEGSLDDIRAGRVYDAQEVGRRIDLKVAAHKQAVCEREDLERASTP